MDYNVALLTSDLNSYAAAFSADGVPYLAIQWDDQGEPYHGLVVHVPSSQMVLEIMASNATGSTSLIANHPNLVISSERRAPTSALARAKKTLESSSSSSGLLAALVVNRAASDVDAIDEFYSNGMQLTTTFSSDGNDGDGDGDGGVSRRCYLWPSATVDVCFTSRSNPNATSTDFSVKDFEDMLNSAHESVVTGGETCNNKWMDNHYAIDSMGSTSFDYVATYIEATPGTYYYCDSATSLHYVVDPTGEIKMSGEWCLLLLFLSCDSSVRERERERNNTQGGGGSLLNP